MPSADAPRSFLITGGTRSGKSRYAQAQALSLSAAPVYIATAIHWDAEFTARIDRHKADRNEQWTNFEEPMYPSLLPIQERIVVIDCVTLWLTNIFQHCQQDVAASLSLFQAEVDRLLPLPAGVFFISNEIGMGMHADTAMGRQFADLQGWANQYLGEKCDRAIFMVSGLPLVLK